MPLRNVRLTPEEQEYVISNLESGRFGNAGELVQAALRALKREERARQERAAKARSDGNEIRLPHFRRINMPRGALLLERRRRLTPTPIG
jgi:putative addiction module CopG family antidote